MRRPMLVLGLVCVLLAVPIAAPAFGACPCRDWARDFMSSPSAQSTFDRQVMFTLGARKGKRVKRGVYDYARTGEFRDPYCKRNSKLCKAIVACVLAGGGAYGAAVNAGQSKAAARRAGAFACAAAASTVMLAP